MTNNTHVIKGYTYGDLLEYKGQTRNQVADALGIGRKSFNAVMSKKDLGHLFTHPQRATDVFTKTKANVTVMLLTVAAHFDKPAGEAAEALGLTVKQFRRACHKHNIHDKFKWLYKGKGEAKPLDHPSDIDLVTHHVVCHVCKKDFTKDLRPGVKIHHINICLQCD